MRGDEAHFLGHFGRHQQRCCCAVAHLAAVAGRHGAAVLEGRLEAGDFVNTKKLILMK